MDFQESIDLFSDDELTSSPAPKAKEQNVQTENLFVEAIQIVRIERTTMGTRRHIIDTIVVKGAEMTYERALKIAKFKASKIGNCMVVEKLERILEQY